MFNFQEPCCDAVKILVVNTAGCAKFPRHNRAERTGRKNLTAGFQEKHRFTPVFETICFSYQTKLWVS
jgi:hypothetical protein